MPTCTVCHNVLRVHLNVGTTCTLAQYALGTIKRSSIDIVKFWMCKMIFILVHSLGGACKGRVPIQYLATIFILSL